MQARDWEDVSRGPDRTLWLGDIGDNRGVRDRGLLVHRVAEPGPGGGRLTPATYRLRYEDGPRDAEALLVTSDRVIVVEKSLGSTAGVYAVDLPLRPGGVVNLLRRVGSAAVPSVTGGDVSPDGTRVVLRNYTAAYEWAIDGGDVVGALAGAPTRIPLPASQQGEGIAYGRDSRSLLTSSEGEAAPVHELRRTAVTDAPEAPEPSEPAAPAVPGWRAPLAAAGVALLGALAVTALRRRGR